MSDPVIISEMGGLLRITLDRPGAGNAVTPALIAGLTAGVAMAEQTETRAVLIEGNGANFCAGADLRHFADHLEHIDVELASMATGFHAMLDRLAALPVPVVVAVQGNAIGAGFGLALIADLIIATDTARFSTGYSRLGLSADAGVSFTLTRAVGARLARSLLITARFVGAPEALALGLIDRVVPVDVLRAEAEEAARALATGATSAYAAIKRLTAQAVAAPSLRSQLDREEAEITSLARDPRVAAAMTAMLKPRSG